ncbi:MAG: metallophosphoesterase family protein, partial [Candidatus Sumerlaeota bacterium]|nr:metallophosphoesterase family protein [Candidatus Sumerlaeota bacterium]
VYGHTHALAVERHDGVWVVNPGPAGRPRLREIPSIVIMEWNSDTGEFAFETIPLPWKRR